MFSHCSFVVQSKCNCICMWVVNFCVCAWEWWKLVWSHANLFNDELLWAFIIWLLIVILNDRSEMRFAWDIILDICMEDKIWGNRPVNQTKKMPWNDSQTWDVIFCLYRPLGLKRRKKNGKLVPGQAPKTFGHSLTFCTVLYFWSWSLTG